MTTPDLEALSQPYLPNASSSREVDITKSMAQVFLTAVVAAKVMDWSGLGQRWSKSGFNTSDFDVTISKGFKEAFKVGMAALLTEAALYGATKHGDPDLISDKVVQDWSITYAASVAEQVANQSTMAVRDIVNAGLNQRLPASVLAERAQAAYGLDPRSANTYQSYMTNKTLPTGKTPIDEMSALLVQRAMTIGDVNTFTGINFGAQLTLMSAIGHGLLPTDARKVWLTALDERVCPTCGPMDGVAVPVNEVFTILMPLPKTARGKNRKSVDAIVPPIHPNCRCTIVLEDEFLGGLITRTARYDSDDDKLARLFSEPEDLQIQKSLGTMWQESKHRRDGIGRFTVTGSSAPKPQPAKEFAFDGTMTNSERNAGAAALGVAVTGAIAYEEMRGVNLLQPLVKITKLGDEAKPIAELARIKSPFGRFHVFDEAKNAQNAQQGLKTLNAHGVSNYETYDFDPMKLKFRPLSEAKAKEYADFCEDLVHLPWKQQRAEVQKLIDADKDFHDFAYTAQKYTQDFDEVRNYHKWLESTGRNSQWEQFSQVMSHSKKSPVLYRGASLRGDVLKKWTTEGEIITIPPSSWSPAERIAAGYGPMTDARARQSAMVNNILDFDDPMELIKGILNGLKDGKGKAGTHVVFRVKNGEGFHIGPFGVAVQHALQDEYLVGGSLKVVKATKHKGVMYVDVEQVGKFTFTGPVSKAALNFVYRDQLGRFAAAGAGVAAIAGGAKGVHYMAVEAPIAGRTRPELNSRLQKTDQRIKHLQTGTYILPRSYLDAHRRAWGFRIGQDAHVDALAAKIKEEGFRRPITLHVYDDQSVIWDGQHRLEASYRLGRSRIPVRVVRRHGNFDPFQEGLLGLIEERRTRRLRQEIARRPNQNVGSLKIGQTPRQRVSNTVNRVFIARGEGETD